MCERLRLFLLPTHPTPEMQVKNRPQTCAAYFVEDANSLNSRRPTPRRPKPEGVS